MRICRWAYGLTTIPERKKGLLPQTLASLREGEFTNPRLFVDGDKDLDWYLSLGFKPEEITLRCPRIRTFGNWILGLAELFIREPACHFYAMFQDDFICYRNLRQYLEKCTYPEKGYWNLYTFTKTNEPIVKDKPVGWYEAGTLGNGPPELRLQAGRGAVALVFNRDAVLALLQHKNIVERPMDAYRGWRAIDGGIVTAMNYQGYREYVHNPSLVQHTGLLSSMNNRFLMPAETFRGESFDALDLLKE